MLKNILSVAGKPGLFQLVSQAKSHVIVESLTDGKRGPVHSYTKISALQDIAIYTMSDEIPLGDVFIKIYEMEGGKETSVKPTSSAAELKDYFEDVLPDYDKDKVYVSDIKKIIRWYNELYSHELVNPEEWAKEKKEMEEAIKAAEEEAEAKE